MVVILTDLLDGQIRTLKEVEDEKVSKRFSVFGFIVEPKETLDLVSNRPKLMRNIKVGSLRADCPVCLMDQIADFIVLALASDCFY